MKDEAITGEDNAIRPYTWELWHDHENGLKTQKRGHLIPRLLELEDGLWGRWDYWARLAMIKELPVERIPEIPFDGQGRRAKKMWETGLNAVGGRGGWKGWDSWDNMRFFLDWLLWGFAHPGQSEPPVEAMGMEGAGERLLATFDLEPVLAEPGDHIGDFMCEMKMGKRDGFFPTPHPLCELMTRTLMGSGSDERNAKVMDPCCGTGRLLLHASNHSLRLYGQDINLMVCKATLVHGYLWAPWLVKPFSWLDETGAAIARYAPDEGSPEQESVLQVAQRMSESATAVAGPMEAAKLVDTVFDPIGTKQVAPILARRKRKTTDNPDQLKMSLFDD